jgi:hypothetical protein
MIAHSEARRFTLAGFQQPDESANQVGPTEGEDQAGSCCELLKSAERLPADVQLTELIVVPGVHCQPYSAFVDLELGDVLFPALMADDDGIWVSDVPCALGDEAQYR